MPRCNYIRSTGAKCKKNCILNSEFCNIHTNIEESDIEVEMEGNEIVVANAFVATATTVAANATTSANAFVATTSANAFVTDDVIDDGEENKVEEISALMFQLRSMNISMTNMINENAALKDKNRTLSQAVDILLEEKKNMEPKKCRTYTVKGLYQRAQLEHYYHKRNDADILAQVDLFYKHGGMPNYNKHGIKICIDGIFDKYKDEDKQYWLNVSQKYFADRKVMPKQ